jgi:hypothetical protein
VDFDGTVYDTAVVERFVGVCVGLMVRTHKNYLKSALIFKRKHNMKLERRRNKYELFPG